MNQQSPRLQALLCSFNATGMVERFPVALDLSMNVSPPKPLDHDIRALCERLRPVPKPIELPAALLAKLGLDP